MFFIAITLSNFAFPQIWLLLKCDETFITPLSNDIDIFKTREASCLKMLILPSASLRKYLNFCSLGKPRAQKISISYDMTGVWKIYNNRTYFKLILPPPSDKLPDVEMFTRCSTSSLHLICSAPNNSFAFSRGFTSTWTVKNVFFFHKFIKVTALSNFDWVIQLLWLKTYQTVKASQNN